MKETSYFFLGGVKVRPECLRNITHEALQIEDAHLPERGTYLG